MRILMLLCQTGTVLPLPYNGNTLSRGIPFPLLFVSLLLPLHMHVAMGL